MRLRELGRSFVWAFAVTHGLSAFLIEIGSVREAAGATGDR
jgi:hypothetical protein